MLDAGRAAAAVLPFAALVVPRVPASGVDVAAGCWQPWRCGCGCGACAAGRVCGAAGRAAAKEAVGAEVDDEVAAAEPRGALAADDDAPAPTERAIAAPTRCATSSTALDTRPGALGGATLAGLGADAGAGDGGSGGGGTLGGGGGGGGIALTPDGGRCGRATLGRCGSAALGRGAGGDAAECRGAADAAVGISPGSSTGGGAARADAFAGRGAGGGAARVVVVALADAFGVGCGGGGGGGLGSVRADDVVRVLVLPLGGGGRDGVVVEGRTAAGAAGGGTTSVDGRALGPGPPARLHGTRRWAHAPHGLHGASSGVRTTHAAPRARHCAHTGSGSCGGVSDAVSGRRRGDAPGTAPCAAPCTRCTSCRGRRRTGGTPARSARTAGRTARRSLCTPRSPCAARPGARAPCTACRWCCTCGRAPARCMSGPQVLGRRRRSLSAWRRVCVLGQELAPVWRQWVLGWC